MLDAPAGTTAWCSAKTKRALLFVGLEARKDAISAAHVPDDARGEVVLHGRIGWPAGHNASTLPGGGHTVRDETDVLQDAG